MWKYRFPHFLFYMKNTELTKQTDIGSAGIRLWMILFMNGHRMSEYFLTTRNDTNRDSINLK